MKRAVYITGTDTGIGKSTVAATLLAGLNDRRMRAVGMKPVASGCERTASGLRNADAELLIAHSAGNPAYANVNPYAFAAPIAPHLAAADAGVELDIERIKSAFAALSTMSQYMIVEGVGGWMAPLGPTLTQADLVRSLELPVILVVGLRLGCINHALLSVRAIHADGCEIAGWIGSCVDPDMLRLEDNISSLRDRVAAPCLGILPNAPALPDIATFASHLKAAHDWLLG